MNKKRKSAIAIYAIVAFVFITLSLVIPFSKPAASWIMFGFSIFSIIAGLLISYYAFGRSHQLMSKFYGYPLFRIGFIYTAIQLLLTIIIYIIGTFVDIPYWVGLAISILLAGLAAIGCIVTENARDIIEEIDHREYSSAQTMTMFKIDISEMVDICKDEEIKEPLIKLATKFKYSDPVSSPKTIDKEKEILEGVNKLKELIQSGSKEDVLNQIDTVSIPLSTRNRICEAGK